MSASCGVAASLLRCGDRHGVRLDCEGNAGCARHAAAVEQQAVGDVHHRRNVGGQRLALCDKGARAAIGLAVAGARFQRIISDHRRSDRAGNVKQVAGLRSAARGCWPVRGPADRGQAERLRPLAGNRVAAEQRDVVIGQSLLEPFVAVQFMLLAEKS